MLLSFPEEPPRTRSRRIYALLLIILLDILLVIALILYFPTLIGSSPNRNVISSNWSGYIVASNLNNPQPSVTSISASWIVPSVNGPTLGSYSAIWIGIGGQFDDTLIQTGTEQDYLQGGQQYLAWYELLPDDSVTIDQLSLKPGDTITASISLLDSADTWSIEIHDVTSNQSFQKNFTYTSSMLSAEWIVETPVVNNHARTLANFDAITFTDCTATIGGETGNINSYPRVTVTMYDHLGRQLVSVSSLSSEGTSFTVNYIASQSVA